MGEAPAARRGSAKPIYIVLSLDPYRKNPEQIYLKKEQMDELYAAMEQTSIRENAWVRHRFADAACLLLRDHLHPLLS